MVKDNHRANIITADAHPKDGSFNYGLSPESVNILSNEC
jgi:hypothetical protein